MDVDSGSGREPRDAPHDRAAAYQLLLAAVIVLAVRALQIALGAG